MLQNAETEAAITHTFCGSARPSAATGGVRRVTEAQAVGAVGAAVGREGSEEGRAREEKEGWRWMIDAYVARPVRLPLCSAADKLASSHDFISFPCCSTHEAGRRANACQCSGARRDRLFIRLINGFGARRARRCRPCAPALHPAHPAGFPGQSELQHRRVQLQQPHRRLQYHRKHPGRQGRRLH